MKRAAEFLKQRIEDFRTKNGSDESWLRDNEVSDIFRVLSSINGGVRSINAGVAVEWIAAVTDAETDKTLPEDTKAMYDANYFHMMREVWIHSSVGRTVFMPMLTTRNSEATHYVLLVIRDGITWEFYDSAMSLNIQDAAKRAFDVFKQRYALLIDPDTKLEFPILKAAKNQSGPMCAFYIIAYAMAITVGIDVVDVAKKLGGKEMNEFFQIFQPMAMTILGDHTLIRAPVHTVDLWLLGKAIEKELDTRNKPMEKVVKHLSQLIELIRNGDNREKTPRFIARKALDKESLGPLMMLSQAYGDSLNENWKKWLQSGKPPMHCLLTV